MWYSQKCSLTGGICTVCVSLSYCSSTVSEALHSKANFIFWLDSEETLIHLQVNHNLHSCPDKKSMGIWFCLKRFGNSPRVTSWSRSESRLPTLLMTAMFCLVHWWQESGKTKRSKSQLDPRNKCYSDVGSP